jgi:hypothetical protein
MSLQEMANFFQVSKKQNAKAKKKKTKQTQKFKED